MFIVAYGLRCNREALLLALNQQLRRDGITTCLWPGIHNLREEEREDKCSEVDHWIKLMSDGDPKKRHAHSYMQKVGRCSLCLHFAPQT